ncbi:MAG: SRPBCC family protein [Proteobacteria bacterium]|nr:SRPBCC family protein [Pseudomonadota bacterium]
MPTIFVSRTVRATPAQVFAALNDFGGVHRYHPLVASSPLEEGSAAGGVGAARTCHFHDGNHVLERVVGAVEGEQLTVDIVDGSLPIRDARAIFDLTPEGGGTRMELRMTYTPPFGVLGTVLNALVIKRKFTGNLDMLLAALDHHLQTGETIEKGWTPLAAA